MNEILKVNVLKIRQRTWTLLDRVLDVIFELWHPQKFPNSCAIFGAKVWVTRDLIFLGKSLNFDSIGGDFAGDVEQT